MNKLKDKLTVLTKRMSQSSFIKSVLTLSAGVVVSQAVSLGTMPIVSRLYAPDVIGDFSLITSSASMLSVMVCIGMMSAIMLPKEDREARGICRLILFSVILLTTLFLCVALATSGVWQAFHVGITYPAGCMILYSYTVLTNISSVCYAYINRQKMYKVLFWNPSLGTITNAVVSIVFGLLHCGLWGYSLGNILAIVVVIIHMLRYANPFSKREDEGTRMMDTLKQYKNFVHYQLPANIIGTVSKQLPVQLISRFFGNAILGSYSMCLNILGLPSKFLAAPINRVFYQEAAERRNNGKNIGEFAFQILRSNIKIAMIPILLLIIFGKQLFCFALGSNWEMAGVLASYLGIYQMMSFCNSCLSGKFILINKQATILILNFSGIAVYFVTFLLCHIVGFSIITTMAVYSIVGALFELIDTLIFMKQTNVSLKEFLRFVVVYLLVPTAVATGIRILLFGNGGI